MLSKTFKIILLVFIKGFENEKKKTFKLLSFISQGKFSAYFNKAFHRTLFEALLMSTKGPINCHSCPTFGTNKLAISDLIDVKSLEIC